MKKLTSFILIVILLFSNLGLAFNVHFCHDKIASISLDYSQAHEDESSCCCVKKSVPKKCCSETTIKVEKKTDDSLLKSFQLNLYQFVVANVVTFSFVSKRIITSNNKLIENYCESNSPPRYKLYCQLVFYA